MTFYLQSLLAEFFLYLSLILPLNILIVSRTGLWSIAHLGFFGIGMLAFSYAVTIQGISPEVAVVVAFFVGAIAVAVVGGCSLRLRNDYFLILSIGFVYFIYSLNISLSGTNGFSRIPVGILGSASGAAGMKVLYYFFPLLVALVLDRRLQNSPLDTVFAFMRQDETSSAALGVRIARMKWSLFFVASILAVWSGIAFALLSHGSSPQRCSMTNAMNIFACLIVGGIGSVRGSIIGAAIFVFLPRLMESLLIDMLGLNLHAAQLAQVVFGVLMIVVLVKQVGRMYG